MFHRNAWLASSLKIETVQVYCSARISQRPCIPKRVREEQKVLHQLHSLFGPKRKISRRYDTLIIGMIGVPDFQKEIL